MAISRAKVVHAQINSDLVRPALLALEKAVRPIFVSKRLVLRSEWLQFELFPALGHIIMVKQSLYKPNKSGVSSLEFKIWVRFAHYVPYVSEIACFYIDARLKNTFTTSYRFCEFMLVACPQ